MNKIGIWIVAVVVFVAAGAAAYVIESVIYRRRGAMGRYESLFEYYKRIDQKQGNIAAAVWALLWILLIVLAAAVIYLLG